MFQIIYNNKKYKIKYNNEYLYYSQIISMNIKDQIIEYSSINLCFEAILEISKINYLNNYEIKVIQSI